jgi:hypothetical protein
MIPWGGFGAWASATMIVFEVPSDAAAAGPANTPVAAVARMSALIAVMYGETSTAGPRLGGCAVGAPALMGDVDDDPRRRREPEYAEAGSAL